MVFESARFASEVIGMGSVPSYSHAAYPHGSSRLDLASHQSYPTTGTQLGLDRSTHFIEHGVKLADARDLTIAKPKLDLSNRRIVVFAQNLIKSLVRLFLRSLIATTARSRSSVSVGATASSLVA